MLWSTCFRKTPFDCDAAGVDGRRATQGCCGDKGGVELAEVHQRVLRVFVMHDLTSRLARRHCHHSANISVATIQPTSRSPSASASGANPSWQRPMSRLPCANADTMPIQILGRLYADSGNPKPTLRMWTFCPRVDRMHRCIRSCTSREKCCSCSWNRIASTPQDSAAAQGNNTYKPSGRRAMSPANYPKSSTRGSVT